MNAWLQIEGGPDGTTVNLVPQGRQGAAALNGLVVRALKAALPELGHLEVSLDTMTISSGRTWMPFICSASWVTVRTPMSAPCP